MFIVNTYIIDVNIVTNRRYERLSLTMLLRILHRLGHNRQLAVFRKRDTHHLVHRHSGERLEPAKFVSRFYMDHFRSE